MERLGLVISNEIQRGRWKSLKLSSTGSVSGLKVNLAKSKAYYSRNVCFNRAMELSQSMGIGITADVGKYLGIPLFHRRVTKLTYYPLIDKVKKRLASWKGKLLTMAGRATLIKSVLTAIPSCQMQTMLLPKCVLRETDKHSRQFFWNQTQEGRNLHLISWEKILQPKEAG
ncbi:hypothetical protein K1719_038274 [Acacia pycnantha]|nr:hypothetical protein K1719_038274 [Acacia pycnantha]